jgi:predicted site-specific integrase-resolvase
MMHPDLEPRVPLGEAARLLGVAHRTLLNHAHLGTLQQLLPGTAKVLGRWRVPVSAIQGLLAVQEQRKPEPLVRQVLRSVDYPHLKRAQPQRDLR